MEQRVGVWRGARAWVRSNPFWVDLAGTALLLLVLLVFTDATGYGTHTFLLLLTVPLIAPLAIRRTRPVLSVVTIYSTGLLLLLLGVWELSPAAIAVPIALYSVTLYGPRWAYLTALFGGFVGTIWLAFGSFEASVGRPLTTGDILSALFATFFAFMFLLTIWAIALMRRSRRETITALVDRATRLEIERDQQHQIATAAERTRIAREMHDIVAHSLSVIIAQADGGRYVAGQDQTAAERVLGTIAETGRDALSDMRRLLGVLRPDADPTSSPAAHRESRGRAVPTSANRVDAPAPLTGESSQVKRTPLPASGDLDVLISQVRASGMRVSLVRVGAPRGLPPGMGLAVFRVCQESLTNVLKHAGPDPTVTVVLRWASDRLHLEMTDDGRGAAANDDGAGHGLLGMGERASMFGGTLSTGPRPGGGFRVTLELPIPAAYREPIEPADSTGTTGSAESAGPNAQHGATTSSAAVAAAGTAAGAGTSPTRTTATGWPPATDPLSSDPPHHPARGSNL